MLWTHSSFLGEKLGLKGAVSARPGAVLSSIFILIEQEGKNKRLVEVAWLALGKVYIRQR